MKVGPVLVFDVEPKYLSAVTPGAYPEEVPVVEEDRMSRSEVMSMFTAMDDRMNTIRPVRVHDNLTPEIRPFRGLRVGWALCGSLNYPLCQSLSYLTSKLLFAPNR